MVETPITERLNYAPIECHSNGLTPSLGILITILILAALWSRLGGITMDTTVSIVITIPAWIMFLGGLTCAIAAVFGARYLRDEL